MYRERDTVYFNLLEQIEDDNCPVCSLINKRIEEAMDSFLYENVTSLPIREEINRARGMCNYHSSMMLKMGNPLAHAIIYENLISIAIKDVDAGQFNKYITHEDCRYCRLAKDNEAIYSKAFLDAFSQEEFREKYRKDGMLCMVHLHTIQQLARRSLKNGTYKTIRDMTMNKYNELLGYLAEIRRKNDYRFMDEQWSDKEKKAWKQAVAVTNDKAGIR